MQSFYLFCVKNVFSKEICYGYYQLQERRQSFRAGFSSGRTNELWEVRADETGLSETEKTGSVHVLSDEREIESASIGSGYESEGNGRRTSKETIGNTSSAGQDGRSEMDGAYEQSEADGGRSGARYLYI